MEMRICCLILCLFFLGKYIETLIFREVSENGDFKFSKTNSLILDLKISYR